MMRVTRDSSFDDVEELKSASKSSGANIGRGRDYPEELWRAAAEVAERRGMNLVCRCLRLDANSLKNWMGKGVSGYKPKNAKKRRSTMTTPAAFVELLTPADCVAASCIIEVESQRGGKLRLELRDTC